MAIEHLHGLAGTSLQRLHAIAERGQGRVGMVVARQPLPNLVGQVQLRNCRLPAPLARRHQEQVPRDRAQVSRGRRRRMLDEGLADHGQEHVLRQVVGLRFVGPQEAQVTPNASLVSPHQAGQVARTLLGRDGHALKVPEEG